MACTLTMMENRIREVQLVISARQAQPTQPRSQQRAWSLRKCSKTFLDVTISISTNAVLKLRRHLRIEQIKTTHHTWLFQCKIWRFKSENTIIARKLGGLHHEPLQKFAKWKSSASFSVVFSCNRILSPWSFIKIALEGKLQRPRILVELFLFPFYEVNTRFSVLG